MAEDPRRTGLGSPAHAQQRRIPRSSLVRFQEDKEHVALKERLLRKYVPTGQPAKATRRTTAKDKNGATANEGEDAETSRIANKSKASTQTAKRQQRSASAMSNASSSGLISDDGNSNSNISATSRLERQSSYESNSNSSDDGGSILSQSHRVLAARSKRYLERLEAEADFKRRLLSKANEKPSDVAVFETLVAQSAAETARLVSNSTENLYADAVTESFEENGHHGDHRKTGKTSKREKQKSTQSKMHQPQPRRATQANANARSVPSGGGQSRSNQSGPGPDSDEELDFRKDSFPAARRHRKKQTVWSRRQPSRSVSSGSGPSPVTSMSAFFGSALAQADDAPGHSRRRRRGAASSRSRTQRSKVAEVVELEEIEDVDSDDDVDDDDQGAAEDSGHDEIHHHRSREAMDTDVTPSTFLSQEVASRVKKEPLRNAKARKDTRRARLDLSLSEIDDNDDDQIQEAESSRGSSVDHVTGTAWFAIQLQKQEANELPTSAKTVASMMRQEQAIRVSPNRRMVHSDAATNSTLHLSSANLITANGRFHALLTKARSKLSQRLSEQLHAEGEPLGELPGEREAAGSIEVFVRSASRTGRLLMLDCVVVAYASTPPDEDADHDHSELQQSKYPPGLPIQVILPRAGRPDVASDSPVGKGPVKREHSSAVASYDFIARMMDQLEHLAGANVASDLEGSRLSLHWPWTRLSLHNSRAFAEASQPLPSCASKATIVASGLVRILETHAECPPILDPQDPSLLNRALTGGSLYDRAAKETLTRTQSLLSEGSPKGASTDVDDGPAKSTARAPAIDPSWTAILNPRRPRCHVETLRGYVAGAILREALLVQNGEATLEAKLAPPAMRYSSVLLAMHSQKTRWYCELLIAPQHVFRFMGILGEDSGGLFELENLVTLTSRPLYLFNDTENSTDTESNSSSFTGGWGEESSLGWSDVLQASIGSFQTEQRSITRLLVSADSDATRVDSPAKCESVPSMRVRLHFAETCPPGRRCEVVCRVLHAVGRSFFVTTWSGPEVWRVDVSDARLASTVQSVCPKGGWLLLRAALHLSVRTLLVDSMCSVERIMWTDAPLGAVSTQALPIDGLKEELGFLPGPLGVMDLSPKMKGLLWCRNVEEPGFAPPRNEELECAITDGRDDISVLMPLLVRYVSLSKSARAHLKASTVELPMLHFAEHGAENLGEGDQIGLLCGKLKRVGWAKKSSLNRENSWRFMPSEVPVSFQDAAKAERDRCVALEVITDSGRRVSIRVRFAHLQSLVGPEVNRATPLMDLLGAGNRIALPCFAKSVVSSHVTSIAVVDERGQSLLSV